MATTVDIDISAITSQPAFRTAELNNEDIWTIQNGACTVGAVMLIRRMGQVALIRKAPRPGYAFSEMLAMPGGLIRARDQMGFEKAFQQYLFERVKLEAGIDVGDLREPKLLSLGACPVSGYRVKGIERRTVIIAVEAVCDRSADLKCADPSVADASWHEVPPPWDRVAPANCLILASALASDLSPDQRSMALARVDAAHSQCCRWAEDVGLPAAGHPFGGPSALE